MGKHAPGKHRASTRAPQQQAAPLFWPVMFFAAILTIGGWTFITTAVAPGDGTFITTTDTATPTIRQPADSGPAPTITDVPPSRTPSAAAGPRSSERAEPWGRTAAPATRPAPEHRSGGASAPVPTPSPSNSWLKPITPAADPTTGTPRPRHSRCGDGR